MTVKGHKGRLLSLDKLTVGVERENLGVGGQGTSMGRRASIEEGSTDRNDSKIPQGDRVGSKD